MYGFKCDRKICGSKVWKNQVSNMNLNMLNLNLSPLSKSIAKWTYVIRKPVKEEPGR